MWISSKQTAGRRCLMPHFCLSSKNPWAGSSLSLSCLTSLILGVDAEGQHPRRAEIGQASTGEFPGIFPNFLCFFQGRWLTKNQTEARFNQLFSLSSWKCNFCLMSWRSAKDVVLSHSLPFLIQTAPTSPEHTPKHSCLIKLCCHS